MLQFLFLESQFSKFRAFLCSNFFWGRSLASFWGLAVLQFIFLESQFSKFLGPCCAPIFFLESQFSKFLGPCCAPISCKKKLQNFIQTMQEVKATEKTAKMRQFLLTVQFKASNWRNYANKIVPEILESSRSNVFLHLTVEFFKPISTESGLQSPIRETTTTKSSRRSSKV